MKLGSTDHVLTSATVRQIDDELAANPLPIGDALDHCVESRQFKPSTHNLVDDFNLISAPMRNRYYPTFYTILLCIPFASSM